MTEQKDQKIKTKIVKKDSTDEELLQKKADDLGIPLLEKAPQNLDREIVHIIGEEVARKYGVAIFGKETSLLKVAARDPQDIEALNMLRFIAQKDHLSIEIYLTSQSVLDDIFQLYTTTATEAVEEVVNTFSNEKAETDERLRGQIKPVDVGRENIQDAPVAKLVQVIIDHAINGKASDIHIEPIEDSYRVRFRVDGLLHSSLTFPQEVGRAVVARVKILSQLKIDEKRKPQDGRFRDDNHGHPVDFRVSVFPVVEGEKVVMRVLEKDSQSFDLKDLGLMGSSYEIFMRRIRDPFGMLLMTGPTGSGKSTSLYGFLKILNKEVSNITTLEDPVEYFIPGVNQSQIRTDIGYTFASGLRSILRQDPNVIMVGEIRDSETAELAVHAALTGHLVFSTVHTNSAIGAIPRLIDMGIEPFLLSSSLSVVAAQRLVRRICEKCKEQEKLPDKMHEDVKAFVGEILPEELKKYDVDISKGLIFYKGKGCEHCGDTGYKGRVAIYEVLEATDEVKEIMIDREGSGPALERYAKKMHMVTMKQDGLMKALLGLTTLSELGRVTEGSMSIGGKIDEVDDEQEENT